MQVYPSLATKAELVDEVCDSCSDASSVYSQIVGPSDGSDYIVDYYGARLVHLSITNETYRRTQLSL